MSAVIHPAPGERVEDAQREPDHRGPGHGLAADELRQHAAPSRTSGPPVHPAQPPLMIRSVGRPPI